MGKIRRYFFQMISAKEKSGPLRPLFPMLAQPEDTPSIKRYPKPAVEEEDLFDQGSTMNQDGGVRYLHSRTHLLTDTNRYLLL